MAYNNQETRYTLKFYSYEMKLTEYMDNNKKKLVKEFNRINEMTSKEINKELGLNKGLKVSHFFLFDNLTDNIILESRLL